jgi:hypothetical protein
MQTARKAVCVSHARSEDMKGQLFPDYIECAFLNEFRCENCGRSKETLQISFPSMAWNRGDGSILISYPVRCSCGTTGRAETKLSFLLFCFICGWLEYQGNTRHRRPQVPEQAQPKESMLLSQIVYDFEQVMNSYGVPNAASFNPEPTDEDRALFGFSPEAWVGFLKRMGFGPNEGTKT